MIDEDIALIKTTIKYSTFNADIIDNIGQRHSGPKHHQQNRTKML